MARNSEKANFMLNRWLSVKNKISKPSFEGRGRYSSVQFTNTIRECETIRFEIMEEISNLAKKLRDCTMSDENEVRHLNSGINSLLKEKYKWECRIVELGGPNYRSRHGQYIESLGGISMPNSSLKIFGVAISLPEYKELLNSDDKTEISSKIVSKPPEVTVCDAYYEEINKKEEDRIKTLEREKEIEFKKKKRFLEKEISVEYLLKLIDDKKKEIEQFN
ncbi:Isy1-like splicing family protein [Cryptosporidium hominis]|nr:Isy1-like splicing family [Cryptosporidium hominis]PPA63859.1 Isy1-like splicing family protein [Cryptosporidium hominis]